MNDKQSKVLVNLDSLVDTRLACVEFIDINLIPKLLENGSLDRRHNTLSRLVPEINDQQIERLFTNRGNNFDIIKLAKRTRLVDRLSIRANKLITVKPNDMGHEQLSITINTYPYVFPDVALNVYKESFAVRWVNIPVSFIYKPYEEYDTTFLKSNFTEIYHHDILSLSEDIVLDLKTNPIPQVQLYIPLCYLKNHEEAAENESATNLTSNLTKSKHIYSQYIDLTFLDLSDFSVYYV